MRTLILIAGLITACDAGPDVDLAPPRIVASSLALPRSVQVPVGATLEVQLSETLDPDSPAGAVALLPWEDAGPCRSHLDCDEDQRCEAARCQEDPVTSTVRSAVQAGEHHDPGIELVVAHGSAGPASRLLITPRWPLAAHRRHALLVGGLADPSGARRGGDGEPWRADFVTAGRGSSGPEPVLAWPLPGARDVPTNVATVEVEYPRPVRGDPADVSWLEAHDGGTGVGLAAPEPCPGWVPGFCLRWELEDELRPRVRYRPVPGTERDVWGRAGWIAPDPGWFEVGLEPDREAPRLDDAVVRRRGPCVIGERVGEAARVTLTVDGSSTMATGTGVVLGLRADAGAHVVQVSAEDASGNHSTRGFDVAAVPGDGRMDLVITEVLANPAGEEPEQEMVEVLAREAGSLAGLYLSDEPWELVEATLAAGDDPPGDALPDVPVAPGDLVVIVSSAHDPTAPGDPAPHPAAIVVHVDASLGASGLSNAGEPVTLYRADPPVLISSYGNHIDTGASAHGGRSVVRTDPNRCDVASAWASHPGGRSTPGSLP